LSLLCPRLGVSLKELPKIKKKSKHSYFLAKKRLLLNSPFNKRRLLVLEVKPKDKGLPYAVEDGEKANNKKNSLISSFLQLEAEIGRTLETCLFYY